MVQPMLDTANHPMGLYGAFAAFTVIAIVLSSWIYYLLDVREVKALLSSGSAVLLHVDAEGTITPEHAARGRHIPLRQLDARAQELPHSSTIVVCSHDARDASKAMKILKGLGFRVRSIADENLALVA